MPRVVLSSNPYEEIGVEVMLIDKPRRAGGARSSHEARLATAYARGGPDHSDLTERGIRGMFYEALELGAQSIWAMQAGLFFVSDALVEKHRWLGQVPEPRPHIGGLNLVGMNNFGIDVTNEDFETSVNISKHDWRRDKTGHLSRRLPQLATAYLDHWNKLSVDVLENNSTAFDGVALFSGAHSIGSSGTMDNDLAAGDIGALNIADTDAITKEEAFNVLTGLASYFFRYKDDQGRPANQAAKDFMVVGPPGHSAGFLAAIKDMTTGTGGTNPLSNLGWTFTYVPEARLSSTTIIYMFRVDDKGSPALILQEEDTPTVELLGEGSEHYVKNNEAIGTAKATRAAAPGMPTRVIRATFS